MATNVGIPADDLKVIIIGIEASREHLEPFLEPATASVPARRGREVLDGFDRLLRGLEGLRESMP